MLDPSTYTLSNGGGPRLNSVAAKDEKSRGKGGLIMIDDRRWKFQDDSQLPKPREFTGFPKRYRAGRGSSVPLNLGALE